MMDIIERFIQRAMLSLEERPAGEYCIHYRDEYGNSLHSINWDVVDTVYGCAIYVRPSHYSRRIIIMRGAVVAFTTDGPYRYCAVYRTPDALYRILRDLDERWEIHINEWSPNDIDFARAVCLR